MPPFTADAHAELSLDFSVVQAQLAKGYEKPFLILDTSIVREKARRFFAAMPRVRPHFAVKSNPDSRVLAVLKEEGVGFEIASIAELDQLLALGVPAAEVFYSNPMKSRAYVEYAVAKGVEWFVIDSVEELEKVHSVSPTAKTYLRVFTSNVGSDWPLSGKFGAYDAETTDIIRRAAELKANLAGVTFHVGSQCLNPENWKIGLDTTRRVFDEMIAAGLTPTLVNIGGGYPVTHTKDIPSIAEVGGIVNEGLKAFPPEVRVIGEPGRYLVSDAGYFVCRVVGTATRQGQRWVYFDAGMFGGIIETTEGLKYTMLTDRTAADIVWTVAGPTCDSLDICTRDQLLPADLVEGDFIYIKNAGAYTTAYASTFNGFPLPDVIVL